MTEPTSPTVPPPGDAPADDQTGTASMRVVTLDRPVKREGETIGIVHVRKPGAGEMRGLSLMALSQLDYVALETLLPRITVPMLTRQEVAELELSDLMQLGAEVMYFLLPKAVRPAFPEA